MQIFLNDQALEVPESATLDVVMTQAKVPEKGVAVALNEQVIPRQKWSQTQLQSQDDVLVIEAAQGG